jgi:hypothetical protein
MLDRQNHAAGGANGSIMVGMFVCLCLTSKKPSEREFFVPAGTDLGVKLIIINYKVNEKLIYFYCLSVNYINRSPTVGNDSQNGIHCCQRAAKIYELTNNIAMNSNIAQFFF